MRRTALVFLAATALTMSAAEPRARADEATVQLAPSQVDLDKDKQPAQGEDVPGPPPEAPPAAPYKRTVVLDSTMGTMVFVGEFGKVAPPALWLHTQLGVELFKWLMFFGEGELAFTDTSNKVDQPRTRSFPLFGFGGGARFTLHVTERVGIFAQASFGAMKADIATNALGVIGFKDAESLGLYAAGRLGVEWYQIDRHFALGLNGGVRDAQSLARVGSSGDTPLVVDGGVALRYAF
jgi:hypothetical protein